MITTTQMIAARGLLGWLQKDLADRIGLSAPTICTYEKGYRLPKDKLSKFLALFEDEGIEFISSSECEGVLLHNKANGA